MITFTDHAKAKLLKELNKLGVTRQHVTKTLKNPDGLLYDALRERYVATDYDRNIALIFEKDNDDITVITIIYSTELRDIVNRRKKAGRWI